MINSNLKLVSAMKDRLSVLGVVVTIGFCPLPLFSANASNTTSNENSSVILSLMDKKSKTFTLSRVYDLRHGYAVSKYYFGALEKKEIYKGQSYGDGENCPQDKENAPNMKFATLQVVPLARDLNGDNLTDLDIRIVERNCENGELKFIEKIFLATQDGFKQVEVVNTKTLQENIKRIVVVQILKVLTVEPDSN